MLFRQLFTFSQKPRILVINDRIVGGETPFLGDLIHLIAGEVPFF